MAANDYYYGYSNSYGSSQTSNHRQNAPLPPLPTSNMPAHTTSYDISPVTSPFDDNAYPYSRPDPPPKPSPYDSSTPAASSRYSYNDPFADKNAIQLQQHKPGASFAGSPTNPEIENGDFPPRDRSSRHDRPPEGIRGWFRGPVTWACFVLSFVQAIVLIVELVRNGIALLSILCVPRSLTDL